MERHAMMLSDMHPHTEVCNQTDVPNDYHAIMNKLFYTWAAIPRFDRCMMEKDAMPITRVSCSYLMQLHVAALLQAIADTCSQNASIECITDSYTRPHELHG